MNFIKKGLVTFAMSMSNIEKDLLTRNEGVLNGYGVNNHHKYNKLMSDLKNGVLSEEVKEFRKHHYEILRESAKYKFKDGQLLSEQEVRQLKITKGDPYDSYPIEVVLDNKPIGSSLLEMTETRPLKVQRGVVPRHKIENYTSTIHIRDIDGTNKLMDFYIPNISENTSIIRELEQLRINPKVSDVVNFVKTSFTTQDSEMLIFEYKMLALDKVVEYNGSYIVKMFAQVTKNGEWAAQKYTVID